MNKFNCVFSLSLIIILGCQSNSIEKINQFDKESIKGYQSLEISTLDKVTSKGLIEGQVTFQVDGLRTTKNLQAYQSTDGQLSFCIPSDWEISELDETLLFCPIGENEASYFTLIVHNKVENSISLLEYRNLLIETLGADSIRTYTILNSSVLEGEHRSFYYLHFEGNRLNSNDKEHSSEAFALLTENDEYIFDFTLKSSGLDQNPFTELIFLSIMQTFKIGKVAVLPDGVTLVNDLME